MKDHFQRGEGGETIGEMRMHHQESMGESYRRKIQGQQHIIKENPNSIIPHISVQFNQQEEFSFDLLNQSFLIWRTLQKDW